MKTYSMWSILLIIAGLLLFGLNRVMPGYVGVIVFIGFTSLFLGAIFSFIAMAKKEENGLKFISLFSFFTILFLVTWFEPIHIIRFMTWMKNLL